jgi:hypothetical protein
MDKRSFTTSEVGKILGKSTRFVIDWTERGLFTADVQPASGAGIKRLFSYSAVLAAAIALALKEKLELPRSIIRGFETIIRQDNFAIEDPKMLEGAKKQKRAFLDTLKDKMTLACYLTGDGFAAHYSSQKIEDLKREEYLPKDIEAIIYVDLSKIKKSVDDRIAGLA